MGPLGALFVGAVVGLVACRLHPYRRHMHLLKAVMLAMGGAVLVSFLGEWIGIFREGGTVSSIVAIVFATMLVAMYGQICRR